MSKRTERRAAEREARKLTYQQLREARTQQLNPAEQADQAPVAPDIEITNTEDALLARAQAFFSTQPDAPSVASMPSVSPTISEAQLAANRANAQLSTGPKSTEGRAKSSRNALKHGLTGQTVVLAGEDTVEYNRKLESYIARFNPANEEELRLVQALLDSNWRMDRLLRLESAIFLKGEIEFANKFEDRTPDEREALIQVEIYLKYEKSLRNLNIQEARLRRCREKDQAELVRLQTIRKREERIAAEAAPTPVPSPNGFEFSSQETPKPTSHFDRQKTLSKVA